MSIGRMVTKIALAFAAKKGIDAFRGRGRTQAATQTDTQPGTSSGGGLSDIMQNLGLGGSGSAGAGGGSIGAVLGSLSTAFGAKPSAETSQNDLEKEFAQTAPLEDSDASPVLRAMVQMARADGAIDEDEQKTLFDAVEDASADERAILTSALREPVDAHALARDVPANARKEVYSAALLISKPEATAPETQFLQNLAQELGFAQNDLDRIHIAMGKPRLMLA